MATAPTPDDPMTDAPAPEPAKINPEALQRLGSTLEGKFKLYESDRRIAELKWTRNARQLLGIYDPDVEKLIDTNRSRAYPKLTRVKCVSMLSRLMNLLFPADDKNWTVAPSAVPNLDEEDLQTVLDELMPQQPQPTQAEGMPPAQAAPQQPPPTDEQVEAAIRKFALKRADRMELEIQDQLQELGGSRASDYVALCRKVLASGIQYGAGILRGPFIEEQTLRTWSVVNGRLTAVPYTAHRPRFEFVSIWDYYPDMSAKTLDQMEGQFLRVVMSKHQVVMLKKRPDFIESQIEKFLAQSPSGNYRRRAYETELRTMGAQINTASNDSNKYEALVWDGYVSGRDLAAAGAKVPDDKLNDDVRGQIWIMNGIVIKAEIDPWTALKTNGDMPQYHHFIFEEDESFLLGNALPNIMRDSQMGLCAAVRITLDNASVQRVFEVNDALIRLDTDVTTINPDMIIHRDDDSPSTVQYPAIRTVELPMHLAEMQSVARMFQDFADQETFVSAATGGDMQKGPSEPFRTAAGASMLRGDAALPFKDVVRNFDVFTESVVNAILTFNRNFNTNKNIRGDFSAVARGATSLIAKEVQGMQLDSLVQTLLPGEQRYVKMRELVRARARVRDLDSTEVIMDDTECDAADQAADKAAQEQQAQATRMMEAQIRVALSDALKNIAQAGKNSANAEATTANVILGALEKGLNPDLLATTAQGEGNGQSDNAAGSSTGEGTGSPAAGESPGAGAGGVEAAAGIAPVTAGQGNAAMPPG